MPNMTVNCRHILIYKLSDNHYMLVVNASNIEKDLNWINSNNNFEAKVTNRSDEYSFCYPRTKSINALQSLTSVNLSDISYYKFKVDEFLGAKDVIISATDILEVVVLKFIVKTKMLFRNYLESGNEFGIKPIGLARQEIPKIRNDIACMVMILMMKHHLFRLVIRLLNSLKILLTLKILRLKKKKDLSQKPPFELTEKAL